MSQPVVVQGTAVAPPAQSYTASPAQSYTASPFNMESGGGGGSGNAAVANGGNRQDKVESKCNDPIFAVLLYICLFAIVAVAVIYGPDALAAADDGTENDFDYTGYIIVTVAITCISFIFAGLAMMIMMCIPQFLIKTALIFSVVLAGIWCAFAFASGNIVGGVFGAIFFAISICYAFMVWSRIPFATANLVTACTAIRSNLGITFYAYTFAALAGAWSVTWAVALVGVYDQTYGCTGEGDTKVCDTPSYGLLFLLFLSFFFVQQVIQNCIHVCIAGTVATWWYVPEEGNSCCSSGINNSFYRTITTSFGSICFGSFLVAIVQALRALANSAQNNGDAQIFACIAECILACLASIIEYFNKWAFIYVGIYGMSYLNAGKSVFELFRNRGWEAIIADDLVGNTLFLMSVLVGGIMGGIGVLIESTTTVFEDAGGNSELIAFLLGFVVGLVITSILMSTIGSGVNAVIVLFAEGPAEFQQNYPELSNKMREVWSEVYPGSV